MLCTTPLPPASPAGSEISVGAPSPPPATQKEGRRGGEDYFRPLKKLKGISGHRERSTTPPSRSSLEGVKSFSIADILGRDRDNEAKVKSELSQANHILQPTKIVRPWDHLRGPVHAVRPFLPPALFHYEHRLALDYQRHLEHLNAQAQLFRQMTMGADIIKSESGSERSSSVASDCCSPEIGSSGSRLSEHHHQAQQPSSPHHGSTQHHSQKTKPNGTPLDALFQMTNKNFDESQGDNFTGTFDVVFAPAEKKKVAPLRQRTFSLFAFSYIYFGLNSSFTFLFIK